MSSVLPIDTQRYQSGNYTLEVNARPSPLSQWSDRPVIRQLRFSLWAEQPERQQILTGDQHQLVTISGAVETYVQKHLNRHAWPQTHHLLLLEQELELSTLELFDLAEVFNAYERGQITLPVTVRQKQRQTSRRRRVQRWGPGSAVASILLAVGATTVYFNHRSNLNEVATTQAPADISTEDFAIAPDPELETGAATAPPLEQAPAGDSDLFPQFKIGQDLARSPVESAERESGELRPLPNAPRPSAGSRFTVPSADADADLEENLSDEASAEEDRLDAPAPGLAELPPPSQPAENSEPSAAASSPETIALTEAVDELKQQDSSGDTAGADADSSEARAADSAAVNSNAEVLAAIATQLAPYQPTEANYPLVYRLQIEPDGTIVGAEPIGENVPAIAVSGETITPAPGRSLTVEIVYTGANQPQVNEL